MSTQEAQRVDHAVGRMQGRAPLTGEIGQFQPLRGDAHPQAPAAQIEFNQARFHGGGARCSRSRTNSARLASKNRGRARLRARKTCQASAATTR